MKEKIGVKSGEMNLSPPPVTRASRRCFWGFGSQSPSTLWAEYIFEATRIISSPKAKQEESRMEKQASKVTVTPTPCCIHLQSWYTVHLGQPPFKNEGRGKAVRTRDLEVTLGK